MGRPARGGWSWVGPAMGRCMLGGRRQGQADDGEDGVGMGSAGAGSTDGTTAAASGPNSGSRAVPRTGQMARGRAAPRSGGKMAGGGDCDAIQSGTGHVGLLGARGGN
jgi:hypothetical protein